MFKERVWSEINCPRCGSPFGEAAAKTAIESGILIDGGDDSMVEIRCPNCLRRFDIWNEGKPSETFKTIAADRLFHTAEADLETFGALRCIGIFK